MLDPHKMKNVWEQQTAKVKHDQTTIWTPWYSIHQWWPFKSFGSTSKHDGLVFPEKTDKTTSQKRVQTCGKQTQWLPFFWCKQAIKELENTACDVWNISETSNESLQSKQTLLAMDGRFVWPWAIAGKLNWIHIDIAICISFQTQFPLIFPPIIWKLARHSYMAWGLMYILHLWFGVSERCWTMNLIWTNDT